MGIENPGYRHVIKEKSKKKKRTSSSNFVDPILFNTFSSFLLSSLPVPSA